MSKLLRGLMAMVVLASGAAFADPGHRATAVRPGHEERERRGDRDHREWVHREYRTGHYETRNVQQWVPAKWVMVQVPLCAPGRVEPFRCHSVRMEQRFVPGHFETVAQQVWVTDRQYADRDDYTYGVSYSYAVPTVQVTAHF